MPFPEEARRREALAVKPVLLLELVRYPATRKHFAEDRGALVRTMGSVTSFSGIDRSSGGGTGHVFISYVREDSARVDAIQSRIEEAGIPVWRDVKDLWPGEVWKRKLREAITAKALAVIPCFSSNTAKRPRSTMFEELSWAAEEFRRRRPDVPWLFPVLLDPGDPPPLDLGGGLTLADLQWTELHHDHDGGVHRLIAALRRLFGEAESRWRLTEPHFFGQDAGAWRLSAEFLPGRGDVVVWEPSDEGPQGFIGLGRRTDLSFDLTPVSPVPFATRVTPGPPGSLVVTQERRGLSVIDAAAWRVTSFLPISEIGDPIIRSESVHRSAPVLVVGTDYGRVVGWNWYEGRLLFRRDLSQHQLAWITGLAIDAAENVALVVSSSSKQLHEVNLDNGETVRELDLIEDENYAVDLHPESGLVAVGGTMALSLFRRSREGLESCFTIYNDHPMTRGVRFSPDGTIVVTACGMLGKGIVTVIDTRSGETIERITRVFSDHGVDPRWFQELQGGSFSDSSDLMAIGQGSRIGIYRRALRSPTAANRES